MRKLIVAGIIWFFLLIAWSCYQKYDTDTVIQSPLNDGISPELVKVFTEIQPIYQEIEEIHRVIGPLDTKIYDAMEREKEILSELKVITDPDEKRKLSQEFQSIRTLELEMASEVLKLQDEAKPLETEMLRILSENGFQSLREFETMHINTYKTWTLKQ